MVGSLRDLLRAFVWLRWRTLLNGLGRRRRGRWQRLGAWTELLGKILLWGMAGSGALGLAAGALFVPWALQPERETAGQGIVLFVLRVGLAVFILTLLVIPAFQGFSGGSFARTRLLLLPIRRRVLHSLEVAAHLADPWVLMVVPALVAVGLGTVFVAGVGGLVVLAASALFALALAAVSSIAAFGIELLLRNRRRAEAVAVVLVAVWVTVAMVPGLLESRREAAEEAAGPATGEVAEAAPGEDTAPAAEPAEPAEGSEGGAAEEAEETDRVLEALSRFPAALQVVPSEAYTRTVFLAARGRPAAALAPLAVLILGTLALHALSHRVWLRLQTEPGVSGGRRGRGETSRPPAVPGLSPAAAAVAWVEVRSLLRTLAGRFGLFLTPVVTLFLALMVRAELPAGLAGGEGLRAAIPGVGVLLAMGAAAMALLSIQNFALNQFAASGPGFTLARLAPVAGRDLVAGKAVAHGLLAAVFALLGSGVVVPLEPAALPFWPAALLAGASAYLLLAPFYAWLSLLLPKAVDLGRMGKSSQPNQVAALLGMLATVLALVPALVLGGTVFAATRSAAAVTLALLLWTAATGVAARFLLRAVADALPAREESIHLALLEGV